MALTFRGGIHPEEMKLTAKCPIIEMPSPDFVTIPLSQHIGAPAIPLVKVGDRVLKGQKIAEAAEGISCPVHASVSGIVTAIKPGVTPDGEGECITIENDFKEEIATEVTPFDTPIGKAEPDSLIRHIREKGIVGMGGAGFPTWAKLESAKGKADRVIINCAECEPYLTGGHRLLLEKTEEIVGGVKILLRALGAEKAIFAVEDNKEDAADALIRLVRSSENFAVALLKTKYPQGDERQLIRALLKKEIPKGALPADVGVAVFNPETCWEIYRAFVTGLPAISRVVTVSGDCVKEPGNLLVPIGVSLRQVLDRCGGFSTMPDKILSGGPMMGMAQWSTAAPVTKKVSGILAITSPVFDSQNCIHCGRCVRACPMHLMPLELSRAVKDTNLPLAELYSITSCSECGCCTYVCPARIPLLQNIRVGKDMLREQKRS